MTIKAIFSSLLIFIVSLSCKQVYEVDVTQPQNETSRYHVFFINRNLNDNIGVIVTDTNKREINFFYGDKNSKGSLINVQQIVTYVPKNKLLLNFELDENLLPQKITSSKNDTTITVQFKNYNLKTNTVDIEIYDAQNALLQSSTNVSCGEALLKFKEAKRQFDIQKGMRLAANAGLLDDDCSPTLRTITTAATGIGCIMGVIALLPTALSIPTGIGAGLFAADLFLTNETCRNFVENSYSQFNGICFEPIDWQDRTLTTGECWLKALQRRFKDARVDIGCILGLISDLSRAYDEQKNPPLPNVPTPSNTPTVFYEGGKSSGDPNIITFDGKSYSFNGVGEFIATKSSTDNFEIQVRQEELKNRNSSGSVSWSTGLAMNTGSDKLCFYPNKYYINQTPYNYSSSINNTLSNGGSITGNTQTFVVNTGNGDIIKIFNRNDALDYSIIPNSQRQGKMIGVFGNYDGQSTNDLLIRNGSPIDGSYGTLYPNFTNSWRIAQNQSLFVYDAGKNTGTYTDVSFPRTPLVITASQRANATQVCKNAGVVAPFLEGCIVDVVATGDNSMADRSKNLQDERTLKSFDIKFGPNDDKSLLSNRINGNLYGADYLLCDGVFPIIDRPVCVINGFETTIYFASEKPEPRTSILSSNLTFNLTGGFDWSISGGQRYDYFDPLLNLLKSIDPTIFIFDGKVHKVVIQSFINTSTRTSTYNLLFDDILVLENKDFTVRRYGNLQNDLLGNTGVSLTFGASLGAPKVKLYRWSFKSF